MDPCKYSVLHERVCNVLKKFGVDIDKKEEPVNSYAIFEDDGKDGEEPHVCPSCPVCAMPSKECEEKIHPYLNDITEINKTLLIDNDNIVDCVISKKFKKPYINIKTENDLNNVIVLNERNIDEPMGRFRDEKSDFKNAVTDAIVKHFFKDEVKYYNFINIIISLFENTINKYIIKKEPILGISLKNKILFVFKGGNLLKSIFIKYTTLIPDTISSYLIENYNKDFKNSDLDFQIFIDVNLGSTEEESRKIYSIIYDDMTLLSYICLNRIRNYIIQEPNKIFDFYCLNNKSKLDILNEVEKECKKSDIFSLNDPENKYFNSEFLNLQFYNIHTNKKAHDLFLDNKDNPNFLYNDKEFLQVVNTHIYGEFPRTDFFITSKKLKKKMVINMTL